MFHNVQPKLKYSTEPYNPERDLVDYSSSADITLAFIIFGVIFLLFRFYNFLLQRLGKLVKLFKVVKTKEGEVICDEDWEF